MARLLVRVRRANMAEILSAARAELSDVPASLRQAQFVVRAATNLVGIVVVLAVVLPEAHRADLKPTPLVESEVAAAGTRVRLVRLWPIDIHKGHSIPARSRISIASSTSVRA